MAENETQNITSKENIKIAENETQNITSKENIKIAENETQNTTPKDSQEENMQVNPMKTVNTTRLPVKHQFASDQIAEDTEKKIDGEK